MPEIKKCPICGSEMTLFEENVWKRLRCSNCPLDFGRYWFETIDNLINSWNDFVSPEVSRENPVLQYRRGEADKNTKAYIKIFGNRRQNGCT